MCLSLRSDKLFRDRPASRDVDDESRYERSQVESAVEPVGEGGQVMACVLVVLQRMKSTGQRGLQVAEHCVDPLELRQIAGLESTDDKRHVATSSIGHRREAAQPGSAQKAAKGAAPTGGRQAPSQEILFTSAGPGHFTEEAQGQASHPESAHQIGRVEAGRAQANFVQAGRRPGTP